jgi:hypothetical protein
MTTSAQTDTVRGQRVFLDSVNVMNVQPLPEMSVATCATIAISLPDHSTEFVREF